MLLVLVLHNAHFLKLTLRLFTVALPGSVGRLSNLQHLDLEFCSKLRGTHGIVSMMKIKVPGCAIYGVS